MFFPAVKLSARLLNFFCEFSWLPYVDKLLALEVLEPREALFACPIRLSLQGILQLYVTADSNWTVDISRAGDLLPLGLVESNLGSSC